MWRDALFLCTKPLFTSESTTEAAALTDAEASVFLPEAMSSPALRSALRARERSATLRVRCLMAWRAAFAADLVLATDRSGAWKKGA